MPPAVATTPFLENGVMSKSDSTPPATPDKPTRPNKPYPTFPLFAHQAGVWAKKIKGKMYYFGKWDDPDEALKKYNAEKDALHAGKKPRPDADGYALKMLCNDFLRAKQALVDSGELTRRSWQNYKETCDLVLAAFGKARLVADLDPDDFGELRKAMVDRGWGAVTLGNCVQRCRVLFKFAFDNGHIDRPVRYGQNFKTPSRKTVRLVRAEKGPKLFTAGEVRALLRGREVSGENGTVLVETAVAMRAMILLGVNCGFGNADCGRLAKANLDLDAGVIDYPRPKTGIQRRCLLWPETVAAIREALAVRPEPKDPADADLVFVTRFGQPRAKDTADQTLSKEFAKLLKAFGFNTRGGLGFYTLRHVFRTVADEAKDQPAADYMMGHESPHMRSVYREAISDERLKAVSHHVRKWLYGPAR
jgi:integrase